MYGSIRQNGWVNGTRWNFIGLVQSTGAEPSRKPPAAKLLVMFSGIFLTGMGTDCMFARPTDATRHASRLDAGDLAIAAKYLPSRGTA